ncbi:MAG TPA: hypothetical protein VD790_04490 [Thermoleophilaceae bacterium]|nr:hypothetical protein [Thermoleophilaceae bacterium]
MFALVAVALCAISIAPAVATASFVSHSGTVWHWTAPPGETNWMYLVTEDRGFGMWTHFLADHASPGGLPSETLSECRQDSQFTWRILCTSMGDTEWSINPGDGNDSIDLCAAKVNVTVHAGDGADTINLPTHAPCPSPPGSYFGDFGNDTISGGPGTDLVSGGDGDDTLHLGPGADEVVGGPGTDWVIFQTPPGAVSDGVTANLDGMIGDGFPGQLGTVSTAENLAGTSFADRLDGNDGPNALYGFGVFGAPGHDVLRGHGGDDDLRIKSGGGANVVEGGAGNDYLQGGLDGDTITGGTGRDSIEGGSGNDAIFVADGEIDPLVDCGPGIDSVEADPLDVLKNCESSGVIITSGPQGAVSSPSASFQYVSPIAVAGSFECSLDGSAFVTCNTQPREYTALADGEHVFKVRYHPNTTAAGPPTERRWTVDTSPPTVTITSAPSGENNPPDAVIEFTTSEAGGAFECVLDTGAPADCASPHQLLALGEGPHTFSVSAVDGVGNRSTAATASWRVRAPADEGAPDGEDGNPVAPPPAGCPNGTVNQVAFGAIVAIAPVPSSCFALIYDEGEVGRVSTGPVFINGIQVRPRPGTKIILSEKALNGMVKTTGPVDFVFAKAVLPIPIAFRWSNAQNALLTEKIDMGEGDSDEEPDFLGLPLVVKPGFELSKENGGQASVTLKIALPKGLFQVVPGESSGEEVGPSFELGFTSSNEKGVTFQGKVAIEQAWLFGLLRLRNIELGFDSSEPSFSGGASLAFGPTNTALGNDAEFRITTELGPDGFFGPLRKFSLVASSLNRPLGTTPLFLQRVGGEFAATTDPAGIEMSALGTVSAGPQILGKTAISADGKVTLGLPRGAPWSIAFDGALKVIDAAIAEGSIKYTHGRHVTVGGKLDHTVGGYGLVAQIDQTRSWLSLSGFSLEGSAQVTMPGILDFVLGAQAEAIVSSKGMAVCAGQEGFRRGFVRRWPESAATFATSGCDIGPLRVVAAAAGRSDSRTVDVAAGTRVQTIAIEGSTAPPKVQVSGPHGFALRTPAGDEGIQLRDTLLVQDPLKRTTFVVLTKPRPGEYTVTAVAGSQLSKVGLATNLPRVSVAAKVAGGRLKWRLKPIPGQQVQFVDVARGAPSIIATTARARGSRRLNVAPGRHAIRALVLQNGLPRDSLTVAHYSGPKLERPAKVKLKGRKLSWRRQPAARSYAVALTTRDGLTASRSTRKPRLRTPKGLILASVVPLDAAGLAGPRAGWKRRPKRG